MSGADGGAIYEFDGWRLAPGQRQLLSRDGELGVGGTVTLQYAVRVKGGVLFGTEMCFGGAVNYDECNTGANTAQRSVPEDEPARMPSSRSSSRAAEKDSASVTV